MQSLSLCKSLNYEWVASVGNEKVSKLWLFCHPQSVEGLDRADVQCRSHPFYSCSYSQSLDPVGVMHAGPICMLFP